MRLENKVALVTGTSLNIGGGIAEGPGGGGRGRSSPSTYVDANATDCARPIETTGWTAAWGPRPRRQRREAWCGDGRRRGAWRPGSTSLVNNAATLQQEEVLDMSPRGLWRAQTVGHPDRRSLPLQRRAAQAMIEARGRRDPQHHLHRRPPGRAAQHRSTATPRAGLLNFTRSTAMELCRPPDPGLLRLDAWTRRTLGGRSRARRAGTRALLPDRLLAAMEPYRAGGRSPDADASPAERLRIAGRCAFPFPDDAAMITGVDLRVDLCAAAEGRGKDVLGSWA